MSKLWETQVSSEESSSMGWTSASTSKNFVFKFEFIVHLQTTKFIVEEGYAKSENNSLVFVSENISARYKFRKREKEYFLLEYFFPTRGPRLENKCEKCVDFGVENGACKEKYSLSYITELMCFGKASFRLKKHGLKSWKLKRKTSEKFLRLKIVYRKFFKRCK